jgi:hypothetical protein
MPPKATNALGKNLKVLKKNTNESPGQEALQSPQPESPYPELRSPSHLIKETIAASALILMRSPITEAKKAAEEAVLIAFMQLEKRLTEMQDAADAAEREDASDSHVTDQAGVAPAPDSEGGRVKASSKKVALYAAYNAGGMTRDAHEPPSSRDVTFYDGNASIVDGELYIAELVPLTRGVWVGDRAFAAKVRNGGVLVYFDEDDGLVRFRAYSAPGYDPTKEPAEVIKEYTSGEVGSVWSVPGA